MNILEMSFYGSAMILAVLLFRTLLLNRMPKRTFTVLWSVAVIRLILPFPLYSPFSLYGLLNLSGPSSESVGGTSAYIGFLNYPSAADFDSQITSEEFSAETATPWLSSSVWLYIWLSGAAAMALTFLLLYFKNKREINASLPVTDEKICGMTGGLLLRRRLEARHSDHISSPLAYGIIRPVILLPSSYLTNSNEKEIKFILTHEFVHIRRFDGIKKLFCIAALCLHWFNPLVWLMFVLFNRDIELACDEGVLRRMGEGLKTEYAAVLIKAEARKSGLGSLFSTFAFKKGAAAEERIKAIMKTKTHTLVSAVLSAILICGSATVFASSPAECTDNTASAPVTSAAQIAVEDNGEGQIDKLTVIKKTANYEENLERYKPFGLEEDENGFLYYKGKRVRFFSDCTEIEEGAEISNFNYIDEAGEVDIHTVYEETPNEDGSSNPFGKLVGIEEYKPGEINFPAMLSPEAVSEGGASIAFIGEGEFKIIEGTEGAYAEGDGSQGGMTLAERFAQYKDYGITYDEKTDSLYYNGKVVKYFIDLTSTEVFTQTFELSEGEEGIVVRTLYDDGGKLYGIEEVVGTELSFDLVETVSYNDMKTINA